ncbi:MAG: septum formation initiator family protein [Sporomusaceae bacterium]|nr:septum formation initiator family protein [Sporomusaceae bacterium]
MSLPKRYKIKWLNLALALLSLYFCYLVTDRYLELASIRRETAAVRQQLEQAKNRNQQLQAEKELLLLPDYVEKLAREQLGLVKPGEVPYVPAGKK